MFGIRLHLLALVDIVLAFARLLIALIGDESYFSVNEWLFLLTLACCVGNGITYPTHGHKLTD